MGKGSWCCFHRRRIQPHFLIQGPCTPTPNGSNTFTPSTDKLVMFITHKTFITPIFPGKYIHGPNPTTYAIIQLITAALADANTTAIRISKQRIEEGRRGFLKRRILCLTYLRDAALSSTTALLFTLRWIAFLGAAFWRDLLWKWFNHVHFLNLKNIQAQIWTAIDPLWRL